MYINNQEVIKSPNHQITKSPNKGVLYVVGTPIGNLKDISIRAKGVLGEVSLVAAEDTRSTRKLLAHLGIKAGLLSCHKHNERTSAKKVITLLEKGKDVALVSEAGTPALSDPGASLVKLVREAGFGVIPVPGASAVITALSVAGMPADSFFLQVFFRISRPKDARPLSNWQKSLTQS